jgi:hypothetical protein
MFSSLPFCHREDRIPLRSGRRKHKGSEKEVPAIYVVDFAVAVIVHVVVRHLTGIQPRSLRQVGVGEVHPVINDSYDEVLISLRHARRLESVHVDVGGSLGTVYRLTGDVETPELTEAGFVPVALGYTLKSGSAYSTSGLEVFDHFTYRLTFDGDHLGVDDAKLLLPLEVLGA